jgi:hypothetical protein
MTDRPRTAFDAIAESIVNPRCDDCGMMMSTPRPDQIGFPRQCGFCQAAADRIRATELRDFMSQERPRGRRVHVVKLPEGMR